MKDKKSFLQFIKFAIVGVSNTLISEGVYAILVFWDIHYILANLIGFALSVLNAFYWNNKYVFVREEGETRVWWKALLKTYAAYGWGYLANALLLILWIDIIGFSKYCGGLVELVAPLNIDRFDADFFGQVIAAGVNLLLTVPMNYLINKYWAFKGNGAKASEQ